MSRLCSVIDTATRITLQSESPARAITSHSGILCTIVAYYTDFPVFFKPFLENFKKKRIYLDYASSTPLDISMLSSFPSISKKYSHANPSALHKEGVSIAKVLQDARDLVAKTLGAHSDEIIFTSNASESDNLAILGSISHFLKEGIKPEEIGVYISPFEHSAVSEAVASLGSDIFICTLLQEDGYVKAKNIVFPEGLKVILISVMMVQNEIGTVQDIKEIAKHIRKLKKDNPALQIIFHTDATQAPLFYDLNVARLGVDMMTLGATKLYCPKGVGLLYKKRVINLSPIFYGGGQEMGLRPGTEPVELIHQFSHALRYASLNKETYTTKIQSLKDYFEKKLKEKFSNIRITGAGDRSPHISHLVFEGIDSELFVLELDARGIAVSSKSACKNEEDGESKLLSILYPNEKVGAIRVSFGRFTKEKDLDFMIKSMSSVFQKYQKVGL
ncbi:MAG: cysteine desulfurase [Patescibacteria group bacterium]|nr:cysteine desulfurase [Patescibacteria group bacterium]